MASLSRWTSARHILTAADLLSLDSFSMASQLDHTPPVLRSWAGLLHKINKVSMIHNHCLFVCLFFPYFEHPSFMITVTRLFKSSRILTVAICTSFQRHLPVQIRRKLSIICILTELILVVHACECVCVCMVGGGEDVSIGR